MAILAGCGAGAPSRPAPRIGADEAAKLTALAGTVARDASGEPCAARAAAASLQTEATAAVNGGRIPLALRPKLLAGVAAVVARAPACTPPAPAPTPVVQAAPPGRAYPYPTRPHGFGHGPGRGHGHGHGHARG